MEKVCVLCAMSVRGEWGCIADLFSGVYACITVISIIIIKRRSGINPIPPTVKDRD